VDIFGFSGEREFWDVPLRKEKRTKSSLAEGKVEDA